MDFLRNLLHQSLGILIESGVIILIAAAVTIVAKQIIQKIYRQIKKNSNKLLREDFVQKIMRPLRWTIWIIAASYFIFIFVVRFELENEFQAGFRLFRTLILIFGVTWFCFEVKDQTMSSWAEHTKNVGKSLDRARILLINKLLSILIILISGLIVLDTLGVHIGALLALGGVGGVTLGFAAKDVFANFFSGFMLHVTKPFSVGDWIHSLDGQMEGTVEHIGFYLTMIRGLDKRPFYVPNSLFSSQITVNATRMSHRRIKQQIGIRYEDFHNLEAIIEDIRAMLATSPHLAKDQHHLADFVEYDSSSLNILVYAFTKATDLKGSLQAQQDVLIAIGKIIQKHGAEIAYPTSTLHINNK